MVHASTAVVNRNNGWEESSLSGGTSLASGDGAERSKLCTGFPLFPYDWFDYLCNFCIIEAYIEIMVE